MKIAVIGGGPGGLYFSVLCKKLLPQAQIEVFERNKSDDSFGFGVVFSDETLSEFLSQDPESYELIRRHFAYWDDLDIVRDGDITRIGGNGFCGCSRKTLLKLLQQRCLEEGVHLHFEKDVDAKELMPKYDLVVAADGIASKAREQFKEAFGTKVVPMKNRFVWMGSTRPLDAFTYFFKRTQNGAMVAHSYQYEEGKSTWIFECSEVTWQNWGFDKLNEEETKLKLQSIYKEELDGHELLLNKSIWRQFPHVTNENWHHENLVLLGDAKATAHFSIGSGTKLAMESAIALAKAVASYPSDLETAFLQYQQDRRNRVARIQEAAKVSLSWFEDMDRHIKLPFYRFAFGVMTRAKRVGYENMLLRDPEFTYRVLEEFQLLEKTVTKSPAFTEYNLGPITLVNRIGMASMGQYRAKEGLPNDWHFNHYTSRALQGLGLITTEFTAVSAESRITNTCTGLYTQNQTAEWQRICNFIHNNSRCKIGVQLGHAGPKAAAVASEKPDEQTFTPSDIIAASDKPFLSGGYAPKAMDRSDMDRVIALFTKAAIRADQACFDFIELQAHHGFLLASFLSPLTNLRNDEYGGNVENRLRFPVQVLQAIKEVWPQEKALVVRISACDWAEGGISKEDSLKIAQAFHNAGADMINVSTGLTVANEQVLKGRMYQVPFAEYIRNSAEIPVTTSGNITEIDQINTILLNGRADLIALGKTLLLNPGFVMHAAAYEGVKPPLPLPYGRAWDHYQKMIQKHREIDYKMKQSLKPASHKI